MKHEDRHIPDPELLMAADGELSSARAEQVQAHLADCWACRARKLEIENTIADFVRLHQRSAEPQLPAAEGARALLKAQLAAAAGVAESRSNRWVDPHIFYRIAAAVVVLLGVWTAAHWRASRAPGVIAVSTPRASLTPGATIRAGVQDVCVAAVPKNRSVPVALQQRVFEEYGISGAQTQAYEVDYLITPALGGADDIHNLWPQSYSATVWNAHVKDALEDRLRELVCQGNLDLATAQREISTDWISAYKKYFHTDRPAGER